MGHWTNYILDRYILTLVIFILLFIIVMYLKLYFFNLHAYYVRKSRRVLKAIRSWRGINLEQKIFSELRSINHFLFEEVVSSAIQDAGGKVVRNKAYTGDFGIDSRFRFNGKKYLVQVKRYSGYISAQDVIKHRKLISRQKCQGLFVHTGKTGKKSRESRGNVQIISGACLLDLLLLRKPLSEIIY